jgi:MoxR-like ATPase
MHDDLLDPLRNQLAAVYRGNPDGIELVLTALVAGGHILLEDIPGVGKTTLARALAQVVGGRFQRVQGTPDLMPGDIIGLSIYEEQQGAFRFHPGPIFCDVLIADELNRMPPRTQSALLEAMSEGQVSVDGASRPLAPTFFCIATQNPHDQVGTYPLPESQTDRFLLRFSLGYPEESAEYELLRSDGAQGALDGMQTVCDPERLLALRQTARRVALSDEVRHYLLALINATRTASAVHIGASPRAAIGLQRAAQARALLSGRDYVIPDDIQQLALPALAHRIRVHAHKNAHDTMAAILDGVQVPR